jgi:hypothetical protein
MVPQFEAITNTAIFEIKVKAIQSLVGCGKSCGDTKSVSKYLQGPGIYRGLALRNASIT